MADYLKQTDLDSLLAEVNARPSGNPDGVVATTDVGGDGGDVATYDFKRPKRVSTEQIRALSAIHDVFSRNFSASLSGFLRAIVDVRVVAVEQILYSEFIQSLPNPTCFVIVQGTPLEGQLFVEFSPLIVYPIIDRLLGGSSSTVFIPQRPLTSIEWRLMARIIERALSDLSQAWRNLMDVRFEIGETESNPHLVNIVAPTEVVVFITFEIKLGTCAGTMGVCIPFSVFESVVGKLTNQAWLVYRAKGASSAQQQRLMRNLSRSTVKLAAYLGATTIRMSELRALRPGDLIALDKRVEGHLLLQVERLNKFAGSLGQLRGHRALRIQRRAEIDEPL